MILILLIQLSLLAVFPVSKSHESRIVPDIGCLVCPPVAVGPNIPIVGEAPPDRQQVEPTISVDPRNPSIIVAGAQDLQLKTVGEHRWHGYYRSVDGGLNWSTGLLPGYPGDNSIQGLSSPLHNSNTTSDPVLAFDNHGNLYYAGLAFNTTGAGNGPPQLFVAKYTDDGATYSGTTLITSPFNADKEWITVDNTGGPYDGNVYLALDGSLNDTTYGTVFMRSTDGGKTFSTPFYTPPDTTGLLPGIAVDHNGDIYVSSDAYDPVTGQPLNYTQVSKITNGGTTLVQNVRAVTGASWIGVPGATFRTPSIPQITADSQGVYLVWDDERLGNANIFFTRSSDGGSSWAAPLRVNDNVTVQNFFPTIAVSAGVISVAWYEGQRVFVPNIGYTFPTNLFYSQSTDQGATFSWNFQVTSQSFDAYRVKRSDPNPANSPFMGDYIGIAATPTSVHPIWTDNRNACDTVDPTYGCVDQDAYTSTITLSHPPLVHDVDVYNLKTSRNFDYNGANSNAILVNTTTANLGSATETFTVTARANSTLIGSVNVTLAPSKSMLVSFPWHAEQLGLGFYNVTAQVSTLNGETDTGNNVAVDQALFAIRLEGDVNNDCTVDISDLVLVGAANGSSGGPQASSNWNPFADVNNDLTIDISDLTIVGSSNGKGC